MAEKRDYYEVLGVARHAGNDEIRKAYRRLAVTHHPDRNQGSPDAAAKFKEATKAYTVLSDTDKRAAYDRLSPGLRRDAHSWRENYEANLVEADTNKVIEKFNPDFGRRPRAMPKAGDRIVKLWDLREKTFEMLKQEKFTLFEKFSIFLMQPVTFFKAIGLATGMRAKKDAVWEDMDHNVYCSKGAQAEATRYLWGMDDKNLKDSFNVKVERAAKRAFDACPDHTLEARAGAVRPIVNKR